MSCCWSYQPQPILRGYESWWGPRLLTGWWDWPQEELARATVTWKQVNFGAVMSGSLQLPHKCAGDRGAVKGVTPTAALNPTVPKGFCLDDVQGYVQGTWRVTIPMFGTINIHGMTDVLGHCMWVHMLAEPAKSPQLPASIVLTANIWRVTPRLLPSANLSEEPAPYNPHQSSHWKSHSGQPGATGGSPNRNLGRVQLWPSERLDPGGIESPGSKGEAQGRTWIDQEAAGQMGTPVCPQWPEPGNNVPNPASNWIDWLDAFQRVLPVNSTHMCMMTWRSISRRCWT